MKHIYIYLFVALAIKFTNANPAFWENTPIDNTIAEVRSLCNEKNDAFSCAKYRFMNFLDTIFKQDNFKVPMTEYML